MRIIPLLAAAITIPSIAFAAGSQDSSPPKSTKTSTECKAGEIFDAASQTCVDAQSGSLNDELRYDAVRELAYAGAYDRALLVLSSMTDQASSPVLTYRGFIARKTGDMDSAMEFYAAALEANADNILARSYMGQAHLTLGDRTGAENQLAEIRMRGGRDTWAEASLKIALQSGKTFSY